MSAGPGSRRPASRLLGPRAHRARRPHDELREAGRRRSRTRTPAAPTPRRAPARAGRCRAVARRSLAARRPAARRACRRCSARSARGSTSRPARSAASWMRRRAIPVSAGVSCAPSHPSATRPTRSSALGPRPPSHTSSGSCTGRPGLGRSVNDHRSERCVTVSPAHHARTRPSTSSSTAPARRAVQAQRLALARLAQAGDEAEQQAAAGELVELGQFLGQQERVASQRHDVGAQPQALGPAGGERPGRAAGRAPGRPGGPRARCRQSRWPRAPRRTPASSRP